VKVVVHTSADNSEVQIALPALAVLAFSRSESICKSIGKLSGRILEILILRWCSESVYYGFKSVR
jgi:hypothetical protein